jgi:hypothetical protein
MIPVAARKGAKYAHGKRLLKNRGMYPLNNTAIKSEQLHAIL